MGKKGKAALLVSKSCYKSAFKMLWSAKGARKPMLEFWTKQLKEEVRLQTSLGFSVLSWCQCDADVFPLTAQMKLLSRQGDSPFQQKVTSRKPLLSFPWRRCLNWAQDKAPLVTTCLRTLFPDVNSLSKSSQ